MSAAWMGAAAALMSLRGKATGIEKGNWMLLIAAFLVIEVTAIRTDRAETNRAQLKALAEERAHFAEVGESIKSVVTQAQTHFETTMVRSDREMAMQSRALVSLNDNLRTITGGESYATLMYVPGNRLLAFIHIGDYPLYGVRARIVLLDSLARASANFEDSLGTVVDVGDMIKGHANPALVPENVASGETIRRIRQFLHA